ncbi:MAG: hypothetical protein ABL977_02025 [Candidatus Eisenbacteria bacterium]
MRIPTLTLLLAIALLAILPSVGRTEARLRVPADVLRAGERVTIEWSGLEPGTHEVEIELSLAGGRWVRISPELEARDGQYLWIVPSGHTGPARLRLRAGGEHREEVVARLDLQLGTALDSPPARVDGSAEWWNLAADSHAPWHASFAGESASWGALVLPLFVPTTSHELSMPPARALDDAPVSTPARTTPLTRTHAFAAPRRAPLRN